ncbi:hypothetical protein CPB86DRAFT_446717 [Serendipita vermifera]|nr:hypothetical protein CPB86DRAFT_446717 [Serendipita vermifera]
MEQITPPRRQRDLLNDDQQADQETLRKCHNDPPYTFTTHETPDSESMQRPQLRTPRQTAFGKTERDAVLIPSTPQTSIESNDGSQLRTPFANVTSWNGVSPGIVSTPTPDFYALNRETRVSTAPSGTTFYPTPQFPAELSTFRNVRQSMESPLKSKGPRAQPIQEETQEQETTPESGVRPLILEPSPSTEERMPEDAVIDDDSTGPPVQLDSISPPVTGEATSDALLDESQASRRSSVQHSLPAQDIPSSRKIVVPESIQKWLQGPSPSSDAHSTAVHRKEIQAITRKRLERFDPQNTRASPLIPHDHESYGRILQPPSKDDQDTEATSALDWPDDTYPWSLPSSKENSVDVRRQQDLQLIARYLEESSESDDDGDSKPDGVTDPADALTALRAKKATRRLVQRKMVMDAVAKAAKGKATAAKASLSELRRAKDGHKDVMELDKNGEDSEEIACICNGVDDGRPMVQCDRCHTWHHVDCVTKEGEELPEEWFCGKCLAASNPGKIDIDESSLSTHERPEAGADNNPAYMHVYLSKDVNSLSPGVPQFFISRDGHIFGNRTPPSSKSSLPRYPYPYSMWPDSNTSPRPSNDQFDDPITAIAATPFGTSSLGSAFGSSEDPFYDNLHSTPSRSLGLRFAPPFSTSPKKDRPWTNYTGAFATPSNTSGSHPTFIFNQSIPIVQTDPLFIHYEHDAPKQTAHHHNGYSRSKKRGKMKDKDNTDMEKLEDRDSILPDDVPSSESTLNVNHETDHPSTKLP